MKLIAFSFLIASFYTFAENYPSNVSVEKYESSDPNVILIPVDFAKEFILDETVLERLRGKIISQIDLVYTDYKESNSFDQNALNQKRIKQLKTLYPQINEDKPKWMSFAQTGATDRATAHSFFHGFAIHVVDPLDYTFLKTFLGDYQVEFELYNMIDEEGGTLKYESGTQLHVPIDAVLYQKDSSEVTGGYTILYREFRNPSQILYSGIPMKYGEAGGEMNFNSAGMYELRAMKDGEELILKKNITVDFVCTEKLSGTAFYKLDEQENNWKKLHDIDFSNEEGKGVADVLPNKECENTKHYLASKSKHPILFTEGRTGLTWKVQSLDNAVAIDFDKRAWKKIGKRIEKEGEYVFLDRNRRKKLLKVSNQDSTGIMNDIEDYAKSKKMNVQEFGAPLDFAMQGFKDDGNRTTSTMLASGMDAGHTYPTLVAGLNSSSFGVYNCDQVFRLPNPVAFTPTYLDETGEEIYGLVSCVIDLNYNGSFSYNPRMVKCSDNGNTVLVMFTKKNQIYVIDQAELHEALQSGAYPTLTMKDMSDQFKTSNDLKSYLNL